MRDASVLLTDPAPVLPMFSGVCMEKLVVLVKLYFPVFVPGAIFGKVIELSGFSTSIVAAVIDVVGRQRAILSIVLAVTGLTHRQAYRDIFVVAVLIGTSGVLVAIGLHYLSGLV